MYGICVVRERLLVIEKILGPYTGQYDLPGGRLENYESLNQGLIREFNEETGYTIGSASALGVWDFNVLWTRMDDAVEHLHHIAIMYEVAVDIQQSPSSVERFIGQDSKSTKWLSQQDVTTSNSSPLVLQAVQWIHSRTVPLTCQIFDYRNK